MKLLVVSAYFESHRGGVELVAAAQSRALAGQGCEVDLLACGVSPAPDPAEGAVSTVSLRASNFTERWLRFPWPLPGPRSAGAILAAVTKSDAIIAHDALYATTIMAYLACRLRRKPLLIVQHVGEVPYKSLVLRWTMRAANALIARPLLARADQVVFISRTTGAHFAGVRYRRPPEYIFNGVDSAVFAPAKSAAEKARLRRSLGLPTDRPVALFVGRFVEKKGLDLIAELARSRPGCFFAFAGWGPIDPELWEAPNVAVFRGLAGPSLADLYRAADVLVLPSVGEGFPLVVQEALACGLPVVCGAETARADEAAGAYLNGVDLTGPRPDVADRLAAAFDEAIAQPLANAAARVRFAHERYSWKAGASRYLELVRRIQREAALDPVEAQPQPRPS
jgi:glycosyltransferase involved in cell wall biosynthesis